MLSNSSSVSLVVETDIEMAWRAFREGDVEYVLVMIMTMMLMLLSVGTEFSLKLLRCPYFNISSRKFKHRTIIDTTCSLGGIIVSSCIITP